MNNATLLDFYDHPKYYDLVFGSDWKAEYDFLLGCFAEFAKRRVERVFEPACGTGRLLFRLADAGFEVSGLDLKPAMVDFCNARLARRGHPPSAFVGDMTQFRLPRKVDAAFNMINTVRHLPEEHAAHSHLQCVAQHLRKGGLYVLGLSLTPTTSIPSQEESWSARRGHLAVITHVWTKQLDLKRRRETIGMAYEVYKPSGSQRFENESVFCTYTARQIKRLLASVPQLEVAATFDFSYDLEAPVEIDSDTEDVVLVLRKV